jgi:hypothetical protein
MLASRTSPGDLEIGGELSGLPPGTVRYVRYDDLIKLPQETYTISDDTNFKGATQISGIALSTLAHLFGKSAHSDLIVAICYDKYRSNYPGDYVAAHHPILVLKINGHARDQWPPSVYGGSLGPYLISHPTFTPSFTVLSHKDEAQIPFGVTRDRLPHRIRRLRRHSVPPGKWSAQRLAGLARVRDRPSGLLPLPRPGSGEGGQMRRAFVAHSRPPGPPPTPAGFSTTSTIPRSIQAGSRNAGPSPTTIEAHSRRPDRLLQDLPPHQERPPGKHHDHAPRQSRSW